MPRPAARLADVSDLIVESAVDGVTTLTMNNPRRLNGWTTEMIAELKAALSRAGTDDATGARIYTPYLRSGWNWLDGCIKMHLPSACI